MTAELIGRAIPRSEKIASGRGDKAGVLPVVDLAASFARDFSPRPVSSVTTSQEQT